jgi:endonuclease G
MQRANTDTFYFTNIAPQHKDFNQGKELWQGLENFVLDNAKGERVRASVFSGPIFRSDDRVYRGVPIPQVCGASIKGPGDAHSSLNDFTPH